MSIYAIVIACSLIPIICACLFTLTIFCKRNLADDADEDLEIPQLKNLFGPEARIFEKTLSDATRDDFETNSITASRESFETNSIDANKKSYSTSTETFSYKAIDDEVEAFYNNRLESMLHRTQEEKSKDSGDNRVMKIFKQATNEIQAAMKENEIGVDNCDQKPKKEFFSETHDLEIAEEDSDAFIDSARFQRRPTDLLADLRAYQSTDEFRVKHAKIEEICDNDDKNEMDFSNIELKGLTRAEKEIASLLMQAEPESSSETGNEDVSSTDEVNSIVDSLKHVKYDTKTEAGEELSALLFNGNRQDFGIEETESEKLNDNNLESDSNETSAVPDSTEDPNIKEIESEKLGENDLESYKEFENSEEYESGNLEEYEPESLDEYELDTADDEINISAINQVTNEAQEVSIPIGDVDENSNDNTNTLNQDETKLTKEAKHGGPANTIFVDPTS